MGKELLAITGREEALRFLRGVARFADPGRASFFRERLEKATPFFVDANVCDLIRAGERSFPTGASIEESDIPSDRGWVYFEKHGIEVADQIIHEDGSSSVRFQSFLPRAISWAFDFGAHELNGCAYWYPTLHVPGEPPPEDYPGVSSAIGFYPTGTFRWVFVNGVQRFVYDEELLGGDLLDGVDETKRTEEEKSRKAVVLWASVALRSLFAFLGEPFIENGTMHVPRQMRRAEAQTLEQSEYRVVRLRRPQGGHGNGTSIEWSCQWLVRGHWRNQWYAKAGCHKPRWIMPYVKGPEDKPLRTGEVIYSVVQ